MILEVMKRKRGSCALTNETWKIVTFLRMKRQLSYKHKDADIIHRLSKLE